VVNSSSMQCGGGQYLYIVCLVTTEYMSSNTLPWRTFSSFETDIQRMTVEPSQP